MVIIFKMELQNDVLVFIRSENDGFKWVMCERRRQTARLALRDNTVMSSITVISENIKSTKEK